MPHKDTPEQEACYEAKKAGGNLLIEAGAGCGKTTVLKGTAKRNKNEKLLYLAFNAAVKDEAKATFPRNAHCLTLAGLAFGPVTSKMKHKLDGPRMYSDQAKSILKISDWLKVGELAGEDITLSPNNLAMIVIKTVDRYCYSTDIEISRKHVPYINGTDAEGMGVLSDFILPYARRAWDDLTHMNGRLGWNRSHDYAFKMFCLMEPDLSSRYDVIMYDEAQDANPAGAGLIQGQDCQQIFVGDRCQAIYGWRGAVDAMADFEAEHRLTLSQSFRFGPAIATEANKWLTLLDAPLRLSGYDQISSDVMDLDEYDAVLCRTNAQAMAEAMAAREAGKTYGVVGGTDDIRRFADAAADLQAGRPADHPDLAGFKNWDQVRKFVEKEDSAKDLKTMVTLVDGYGVPAIRQLAIEAIDEKHAQVTISTAHKAKGREWPRVKIAADFREPEPDPKTGKVEINREEAMLAYVSVTRAQQFLDAGPLEWVNRFLAPVIGLASEPVVKAKRTLQVLLAERRANRDDKE